MIARICLAAGGASLFFFAGCATVQRIPPVVIPPARVEAQAKPTDYSVEILLLDVNKLCRKLLFSNADGNLEAVMKDPETVVTRGPALYVTPGSTATMEERKIYRYPVEFDAQGQPTQYQTRSVGPLIQVGLEFDRAGRLQASVTVEDNLLRGLEPIQTPAKTIYERPLVDVRKASGTSPVEPGKWAVVSSEAVIVETKGKKGIVRDQHWRTILVKALPPKQR